MTNPQAEANGQKGGNDTKPVEEWSDEDLKEALTKVWEKYIEDWSTEDFRIVWEDYRRKWSETRSKLEALQGKAEFSLEEWIRLLAEAALDIYVVEKQIQFQTLYIRRQLGVLRDNLHIVNENVCRIPPPIPPREPPGLVLGPDMYRIQAMLRAILSHLGISYHDTYGDR